MTSRFLAIPLLAAAAWAQPAFEAASIRPSGSASRSIQLTSRAVTMRTQLLSEYVRWAYNTQLPLIVGPYWLNELRFDITATAEADSSEEEMRLMMQRLLAERFDLALHRETRVLPVLEITEAKGGHKMRVFDGTGSPSYRAGNLSVSGVGVTLEPLVETLSTFLSTPVVDRTGLLGKYNYDVEIRSFITDDVRRNAVVQLPVVIGQAVQEQIGLRIIPVKASVEVLVIDHIENQPTEN